MMSDVPTVRSRRVIATLADSDPEFIGLCKSLYGDTATIDDIWRDAYVSKMNPASGPDVHQNSSAGTGRPRDAKWALRVAVLGAGAGAGIAAKEGIEGAGQLVRGKDVHLPKVGARLVPSNKRVAGAGKLAWASTAGGADVVAAHLARREQKTTRQAIAKALGSASVNEMAKGILVQSRRVTGAMLEHSGAKDRLGAAADPAKAQAGKWRPPNKVASGGADRTTVARGTKVKTAAGDKQADQLSMFDPQGKPAGESKAGGKAFPTAKSASTREAGAMAGRGVNAATGTPQAVAATVGVAAAGALALGAHKHRKGAEAQSAGYYEQPAYFGKSEKVDVELVGKVSKVNAEKRMAFGWCSVSKIDGLLVTDKQGDILEIEDTEDAAYDYNLHSRAGGDMHLRTDGFSVYPDTQQKPGDRPVQVADCVESMVFTPDKIEALGLPDNFPQGWWIGMRYQETPEGEEAWQNVLTGKRPGFSIHGSGIRVPVAA